MAIVCAVGENLRADPTLFARAVTALERDSAAAGLAGGVAAEHHVRAARRGRRRGDEAAARRVLRRDGGIVDGSRCHANPAGRPRPDGAARRRAGAASTACEVAGVVDPLSPRTPAGIDDPRWDGRRRGDRLLVAGRGGRRTCRRWRRRGINVVVGTTGWQQHEAALRQAVADAGVGHRRRAELLDRRRAVRGDGRARGGAVRRRRPSSARGSTRRITRRRRTRRPARR